MPQSRDTSVESQLVREDVLDHLRADGVQVLVVGPFRDDDDSLPLANFAMLVTMYGESVMFGCVAQRRQDAYALDHLAHLVFP